MSRLGAHPGGARVPPAAARHRGVSTSAVCSSVHFPHGPQTWAYRLASIKKNVWYRSSVGTTIEDRGTVTVENGTFAFTSRKQTVSGRIRSAGRRPMGFKSWVEVSYDAGGETKEAYFLVKDMLGWAGMLGGNRQLTEAFQATTAQT